MIFNFRGTLGNRRRVGRVGRSRVAGARSARMRATSGKSLFTETLYVTQIIGYYGIWLFWNLAITDKAYTWN